MPYLLEAAASESQKTGALQEAIDLRQQALALRRAADDRQREGTNLRLLGVLHRQSSGDKAEYLRFARAAVEVLEPLGPSGELAKAYASLSQCICLLSNYDEAIDWGARAVHLAQASSDSAALALALNRHGTAQLYKTNDARARAQLERALALAIDAALKTWRQISTSAFRPARSTTTITHLRSTLVGAVSPTATRAISTAMPLVCAVVARIRLPVSAAGTKPSRSTRYARERPTHRRSCVRLANTHCAGSSKGAGICRRQRAGCPRSPPMWRISGATRRRNCTRCRSNTNHRRLPPRAPRPHGCAVITKQRLKWPGSDWRMHSQRATAGSRALCWSG